MVQLVGYDALPEKEKEVLDIAKSVREDFLQQSAFDDVDTYTSLHKQMLMLKAIIAMDEAESRAVSRGVLVEQMNGISAKQKVARMKLAKEDSIDAYYDDVVAAVKEIDQIMASKEKVMQ